MRTRFLLIGTVVCAMVLFAWQSLSNAALPWHEKTLSAFTDPAAVVRVVQANASRNGVYVAPEGLVAAVSFVPGVADKSKEMTGMLARQMAIDLATALLLCLLVLRLPPGPAKRTGTTLGLAGLATALVIELSDWNWYGFAGTYEIVNVIDHTIQWMIAGLLLGWLYNRGRRMASAGGGELPAFDSRREAALSRR